MTFDPTTSRSCAEIPIIDDDVPEDDETFTVTVTDTGINITPDTGIVTIVDDDCRFCSVCACVCTCTCMCNAYKCHTLPRMFTYFTMSLIDIYSILLLATHKLAFIKKNQC